MHSLCRNEHLTMVWVYWRSEEDISDLLYHNHHFESVGTWQVPRVFGGGCWGEVGRVAEYLVNLFVFSSSSVFFPCHYEFWMSLGNFRILLYHNFNIFSSLPTAICTVCVWFVTESLSRNNILWDYRITVTTPTSACKLFG